MEISFRVLIKIWHQFIDRLFFSLAVAPTPPMIFGPSTSSDSASAPSNSSSTMEVVAQRRTELTCVVARGKPAATITWQKCATQECAEKDWRDVDHGGRSVLGKLESGCDLRVCYVVIFYQPTWERQKTHHQKNSKTKKYHFIPNKACSCFESINQLLYCMDASSPVICSITGLWY